MRRALGLSLVLALVPALPMPAAAPSAEAQIRKVVDDFAAAWNKHDPTEMAYLWSADGDLMNPFGKKASGLLQIERLLESEHATVMKNSTFKIASMSVRVLEPTLAVLDADAEIEGIANPDGTTVTLKPHVTNLMRKSGGRWWIASSRAFLFPPPAPPAVK